jgi:hypothetical protein
MQSFKESGIYEILFKKNDPSNSIIDPLTCVVRLALLKYKPHGTKISVKENQITYNEPCILQGSIRWTFGDCRDDLHNLFNPLKKGLEWFNLNNSEIYGLFNFCVEGLECLKQTYDKNSIIAHSLDHYISIIELQISTVKKPRNSSARDGNLSESTMRLDIDENEKRKKNEVETNNRIYKLLRELWSEREILIIYNLLLELDILKKGNGNRSELSSLINSLDSILVMKEQKVNHLLLQSATVL